MDWDAVDISTIKRILTNPKKYSSLTTTVFDW